MAKAWKAIIVIVLVAAILGSLFMTIGIMTGADYGRIYQTIADRYGLVDDYNAYIQYANDLFAAITNGIHPEENVTIIE